MEHEGYVSLWVGNVKTDDDRFDYINLMYSDDGSEVTSNFLEDFNIDPDEFDEDFVESEHFEEKRAKVANILSGCSYDYNIIPRFIDLIGETLTSKYNCAILLYNFQYKGNIKSVEKTNYDFLFLGSVKFNSQY